MLRRGAKTLLQAASEASSSSSSSAPIVAHTRSFVYVPQPGDAKPRTVTLIPGDGIGPEVSAAVAACVGAMDAPIKWERFTNLSGSKVDEVPSDLLESIRRNKVAFKGTLFTPLSKHNTDTQSLNVMLRKQLDLFANIVHAYSIPGLNTRHEKVDVVVIRENTEGEYSGLEHEVVPGVVESIKFCTYDSCVRVAEYAFEFARLNNRKRVTVVHKANIMKATDGLFLTACREVAQRHPAIEFKEAIVDAACMDMTSSPEKFDVIITSNLYGNLLSNIAAGIVGGTGIAPGANVGHGIALFEQGARDVQKSLAGKGIANPTASLLSTALMLRHMNLATYADRLQHAVHAVIKEGNAKALTPDMGGTGKTMDMVLAIISKL